MLLGVVALTGNVSSHDLAISETDSAGLSVGGVGLLGLENHDSQHNTTLKRVALEIGGHGALGLSSFQQCFEVTAARNLVDSSVADLRLGHGYRGFLRKLGQRERRLGQEWRGELGSKGSSRRGKRSLC